ncbi:paraquat-inducible protein A [Inquilinus ginsengisoli]|uniref:Paraquat-inducible protein A n=1 Tax=Inquilinus ginsengisoli TaxID=363840 RepID=A0ABU1JZL8_9PROT|nr:paraquat-inducible protein A [Inquilinus ginsengisoli]MDR6294065.1 paraquat-inducible protein A [Inquilinus ginsengisoli]
MSDIAATRTGPTDPGTGRLMECHECGLRHDVPALPDGTAARCSRCGATLHKFRATSLDHAFAYTCAGLVFFLMANLLPFISLEISGRIQAASLVTGVVTLYRQGLWELAAVVALTMFVAPGLRLGTLALVLGGLRLKRPPRWLPRLYRWAELLGPWAMMEVYLLGVFVAYVKLIDLATVDIGPGLYSVGALMLAIIAAGTSLDNQTVWRVFERRGLVPTPPAADPARPARLCHACGLVSNVTPGAHAGCPRCGAALHRRKPDSLTRTWALVITAIILYIPANILPVMTVISLGSGAPDTIMSGVIELADSGMWPLAALVFFASITVPVLKLAGLITLLVTTRRGTRRRLQDRTVLYRIVEAVGRWSMIDIFMISILVALVQLGQIATIEPGIGAVSFAAVVIITMIAAMSFDPRLMWDAAGENSADHD